MGVADLLYSYFQTSISGLSAEHRSTQARLLGTGLTRTNRTTRNAPRSVFSNRQMPATRNKPYVIQSYLLLLVHITITTKSIKKKKKKKKRGGWFG